MVSHKGKSSALLGVFVFRDVDVTNLSIFLKQVLQILIAGAVGQIVNFQRNHPARIWGRSSSIARHFRARTKLYLEKIDKFHTNSGKPDF